MTKFVGEFSESDITNGLDQICVANVQKQTGLKYTNTELVKRNGKIVGIKIWACDLADMKI